MEPLLRNSKAFQTRVVKQVLASLAKYTDGVEIPLPTLERKMNQLSPFAKYSTNLLARAERHPLMPVFM